MVALCLVMAACAVQNRPASLVRGRDTCAQCRMVIVSQATAGQIVAPGDEPRFFDEIACLRDYLADSAHTFPDDAVLYVADHRTGDWVEASVAVFTRTTMATAMASGLIAHASVASREADPAATNGTLVARSVALGPRAERTAP
jgi:copper chaperone NosL